MNQIELGCAKEGRTVVVLDINRTHAEEHVFSKIRDEFRLKTIRIHALQDGLGISFLRSVRSIQGTEEPFVNLVNSAVKALSTGYGMGMRQIGILREAVIWAIHNCNKFPTEVEALAYGLLSQGKSGQTVYSKLWTVLNSGVLKPSVKTIQTGCINIIDFSGLDMTTQTILAGLVLSYLWRVVQFGGTQTGQERLTIVLDEFQNLPMQKDSVLRNMLCEGRKFGISLVMATQSLRVFPKDTLAVLSQTASKIYFRPSLTEAHAIAKEIAQEKAKEYKEKILSLGIGESIAVGDLCVDGNEIHRPLLLR